MKIKMAALYVSAASAALLAFQARPALAADPSDAKASQNPATLEEVVVTATKREQSLRDVPLSITAVTETQLRARGVESFQDLARLVPGVVQSGSNNFAKFAVRGIQTSNTTSSSGEQKAVAVYLDDLPLTSFSILTPEISPYDISRVEVLRGPQGTLFGSGTLAGAVRFVTNKPNLHSIQGSVDGDLGVTKGDSYRRRISAMANMPLVEDQLALRIVGYYRNEDGYVENVVRGTKNDDTTKAYGGRVSLRWQPTDTLTVTLAATDDHNKLGDASRYDARFGVNKANSRIPYTVDIDLKTYNGTLDYDFGWAKFTSSTTYAVVGTNWSLDINTVGAIPLFLNERIHADSVVEDARFVSRQGGRFDWVVGAFYLDQKSNFLDDNFVTPAYLASKNITGLAHNLSPGVDLTNDIRRFKNHEAAIYGEGNFHITEALTFTAGYRETQFEFNSQQDPRSFTGTSALIAAVGVGGNRAIVPSPLPPNFLTTGRHSKLTQKYSLTWKPERNETFYLSAAEGFRRGHPNNGAKVNGGKSTVDPNDPTIIPAAALPDSLWNYEIGSKTLLFDGRLSANIAAYYIPWGPIQVGLVRPSDVQPFVGNVGKVVSKGVEVELQAKPVSDLELGLNLTLQSSKVTQLTAAEALSSGALLGSRTASPRFQISGYAQKTWELADGGEIRARVDAQHVGSYPNSFPNTPGVLRPNPNYFVDPAYDNVDVSLGWSKGQTRLAIYGENILDNHTPVGINASGSSTNRYLTLRPRTIGIRAGWTY